MTHKTRIKKAMVWRTLHDRVYRIRTGTNRQTALHEDSSVVEESIVGMSSEMRGSMPMKKTTAGQDGCLGRREG